MTFAHTREVYDRYMGRYSERLAPELIDFAQVTKPMSVLDVGCGPGALTEALARHLGPTRVAAADPSESLLSACAERVPEVDTRIAPAAELPWPDGSFDAVLSQLVLNFLPDADAGVAEMRRVTEPGGILSSCTWDYAGGMTMLRTFWNAAVALDPAAPDEGSMPATTEDGLADLWVRNGLAEVETDDLVVSVEYVDFEDYWVPFTLGVGPAGAYCLSLDMARRDVLHDACFVALGSPSGSFTLEARAVAVRGLRT